MNMGASIPMAHGMRRALPPEQARRVVSVIGDSTFFHSGIAGLLDIVHNGGSGVTLVLDNSTTAMTGHQDHPGVYDRLGNGAPAQAIDIAAVARSIGVPHVEVVDPYDIAGLRGVLEEAMARDAASVIVARAPCVLRERVRFGDALCVDESRCSECHACLDVGCPAMTLVGSRVVVDRSACNGCALCSLVCNDCNTGLNIGRILELVAAGRDADAIALVLETNPLPAISARVCPHPCDHTMNALGRDHHADYAQRFPTLVQRFGDATRPGRIAVRDVERYLGDLAIATRVPLDVPSAIPRGGSVAIVGAGPSALSAAYQLRLYGCAVTIYDEAREPGGVLRHGIPEFRLPRDVLDAEVQRLLDAGVEFRGGVRVGSDITLDDLRTGHDAVLIAVGYSRARALPLDGAEGVTGVFAGTAFLRQWNAGERPALGARVAVIGGGNTAIDCARAAVRSGAEVTIYYRRGEAEMPAIADEVEAARAEGVCIETLTLPRRVIADDARRVCGVEIVRMTLGERDATGRARPLPVAGTERVVEADTVIIAAGEEADLALLGSSSIETNGNGNGVRVEFTGVTNQPGVFACGDVAFGNGTVTQAIGTGRRVADAVIRFLKASGV
jgi:NADPH-dependent glutamate synthase beta subunit-like oxidoreductase